MREFILFPYANPELTSKPKNSEVAQRIGVETLESLNEENIMPPRVSGVWVTRPKDMLSWTVIEQSYPKDWV
jgi:hypothetical protein